MTKRLFIRRAIRETYFQIKKILDWTDKSQIKRNFFSDPSWYHKAERAYLKHDLENAQLEA